MAKSVQAEVLAGKEIVAEYIGLDPALLRVRKRANAFLWTRSTEEPLFTHFVSQCRPWPCVLVMKLRSGAETLSAGLTSLSVPVFVSLPMLKTSILFNHSERVPTKL